MASPRFGFIDTCPCARLDRQGGSAATAARVSDRGGARRRRWPARLQGHVHGATRPSRPPPSEPGHPAAARASWRTSAHLEKGPSASFMPGASHSDSGKVVSPPSSTCRGCSRSGGCGAQAAGNPAAAGRLQHAAGLHSPRPARPATHIRQVDEHGGGARRVVVQAVVVRFIFLAVPVAQHLRRWTMERASGRWRHAGVVCSAPLGTLDRRGTRPPSAAPTPPSPPGCPPGG